MNTFYRPKLPFGTHINYKFQPAARSSMGDLK
jgi:hypothetical protein